MLDIYVYISKAGVISPLHIIASEGFERASVYAGMGTYTAIYYAFQLMDMDQWKRTR